MWEACVGHARWVQLYDLWLSLARMCRMCLIHASEVPIFAVRSVRLTHVSDACILCVSDTCLARVRLLHVSHARV